ncbi:MAG: hypothetical protein ACFE8B_04645 [Candidatus Hermodarchaeota archaeon]
MCAKFRGIPAVIYSGLWRRQIFGRLKKDFPDKTKFVVYITDQPPAVSIVIDNGNFEMEKLDNIKELDDLEKIDCDGYFAAPHSYLFGGIPALKKGIDEGKVKMRNEAIIFSILLRNLQ